MTTSPTAFYHFNGTCPGVNSGAVLAYHSDVSKIHPEGPGPDTFGWLAAAGIFLRQEPDQEPDEDEEEGDDKEANDDDGDGYSE